MAYKNRQELIRSAECQGMRVFVTGGTGLIGRHLARRLLDRRDGVVVLSRHPDRARDMPELAGAEILGGDPTTLGDWTSSLENCDAVVNLAGENLFAQRWSAEFRRRIRNSRVVTTENLVTALRQSPRHARVLVSGSAVGYYGSRGEEELDESSPPGTDFMAEVCVAWEQAAEKAESLGVRVARIRTSVVLDPREGALGAMVPIYKRVPGGAAPVGGRLIGTGRQWMSWIHRDDIVGLFLLALDHPEASGSINGASPRPLRNREFGRALANALHRPFLPIGPPDLIPRIMLGGVSQVITCGQRVLPARAEALGYTFRFPDITTAFADLFAPQSHQTTPATMSDPPTW